MAKIALQKAFLVSGIMCFEGCGNIIQSSLQYCLEECKKKAYIAADGQLTMDAEPVSLGIHRLILTLEGEDVPLIQNETTIWNEFKQSIPFEVIESAAKAKKFDNINWLNMGVNLLTIALVSILWVFFPPSALLTFGLTSLSFLVTAFTARDYLFNFMRNVRHKNLMNMTTTITLGWLLSLVHTLYHALIMPAVHHFSMFFMNFIMPITLMTIINGMDEIKRLVLNKASKMHLQGMRTLFPQMAEKYSYYLLSSEDEASLAELLPQDISLVSTGQVKKKNRMLRLAKNLSQTELITKNALRRNMIIEINPNECFPVDCMVLKGNTVINASLLTGESYKNVEPFDWVPAGAINLGKPVAVCTLKDAYQSTVNQLLFCANRALDSTPTTTSPFVYLYTVLILLAITASILMPFAFGILTVPIILQNVMGILFAICPCTIAIAHQLPPLLHTYCCSHNGILLRDENVNNLTDDIHTVVFDKTGTLTTGDCAVKFFEGLNDSLWQRIYLLEKHYGAAHPLAKAIVNYYEKNSSSRSLIEDIQQVSFDAKNRGLVAKVQGKKVQIGNADYLREAGIILPEIARDEMDQGLTPVYVAESNVFKGIIFIEHTIREGILPTLQALKNKGKRIIMLTGDNQLSAHGLNRRLGEIFNPEDIYAEKNPQEKENKLKDLKINDKLNGVWFIGDGLNDAPCARTTTEYGGISCAITADDKASFFANISLNGSLDYLFKHAKITRFLQKNVRQNQGILAYSALVFLAFILCFSISGIAVSPLIPLVIMVSTTLFTLFNSYRSQLTVDNALDKHSTWPKQLLASDLSIGLLMTASSLLICGLLITTVATGGLALPAIVFTAGAVATISSVCLITAAALFGVFALLATTYFVAEKSYNPGSKMHKIEVNTAPSLRVQTQDACLKLTTIPPVSPSNLPEETVTSGFVLATKLF